ncbi:MAG: GTP-binding protein, partial [Candidatus Latescibacteria bacterium]|nr:GTP-binding protein [Candidatus Latescibacterota bacterium]
MMQKKVCMLGAFAVGKTSLISRYVHSMFSDKYQTTVGVKIDKKVVSVGEHDMTLILWDVYGEDDFMKLRMSYLRGAAGYFLVADGTRKETLDVAEDLKARVTDSLGDVPFILLLNKADLQDN